VGSVETPIPGRADKFVEALIYDRQEKREIAYCRDLSFKASAREEVSSKQPKANST
jgi:hypothetical protein